MSTPLWPRMRWIRFKPRPFSIINISTQLRISSPSLLPNSYSSRGLSFRSSAGGEMVRASRGETLTTRRPPWTHLCASLPARMTPPRLAHRASTLVSSQTGTEPIRMAAVAVVRWSKLFWLEVWSRQTKTLPTVSTSWMRIRSNCWWTSR